MAGSTPQYGLAFFDFGDALDSTINVQKEVDRFFLIDEQLYGLYSVFGNGVISGWDITIGSDLSLTINPGIGIINALAVESTFPQDVDNLPANDSFGIYAVIQGDTQSNRTVAFQFSRTDLGDLSIKIADVVTSSSGVISADTSQRPLIGFESIIDYQVKHHRHTGSPPKIDLELETTGLLPGSKIDNLDASIVTSGKFNVNVIPQIDHSSLKNIGFLTHTQIDSLIGSLQRDNEQLLGEVSTTNLLRYILAEKYKDADVDQTFFNEIAIVPGISPSSFTDMDNTTANIDEDTMCISGIPASYLKPGIDGGTEADLQVVPVTWQSDTDFNNASVLSNLQVLNGVRLLSDTLEDLVVEDFEVTQQSSAAGFTGTLQETTNVSATYSQSVAAQGFSSGEFDIQHNYYAVFTKTYSTPLDWTNYNELVVYVRSYSASHAAVFMKILSKDGTELTTYTLLAADEVTSSNVNSDGFAEKTFDITTLTRNNIAQIIIYTSNIQTNEEIFYLDNIFVRNTSILLPQGTLRLRYSSATTVIFRMIEFTSVIPTGTDLRVRTRIADDVNSLITAPFGTRLMSGDAFSISGKEIEIELTFYADSTRTLTPDLSFVQLQMLIQSQDVGFTVKDAQSWARGTPSNTIVTQDTNDNSFTHLQYTNVGNRYFIYQNTVNEIDPNTIPQFGVNGSSAPISPLQGFNALQGAQSSGFNNPKSVYRLVTGDYLVADTLNDRVIQVNPSGTFVRGFGCHNRDYDTTSYSLSAVYNPTLMKLFITYSQDQLLSLFDLTKVHISWGSNVITLDNTSDQIRTLNTDLAVPLAPTATSSPTDRIISIKLSQAHADLLATVTDPLFVQIDTDPDPKLLECFVGDFMYYGRGAILHPIFANKLDDTRWMIANSHILTGYDDLLATTTGAATVATLISQTLSIINIDEDTGLITVNSSLNIFDFTYNGISFSDITLGGIVPVGTEQLLIAGLNNITSTTVADQTTTASTGTTITNTQRLAGYQGFVILLDKVSQQILFKYQSPEGLFPSDIIIDDDGLYVIAETSFVPQAGRIIKIDRFGNILSVISDGLYTQINDIRKLPSNHLLVST